MDWQNDERNEEFEVFLRQFQPRRPPPLKGPLVTTGRMAIAAGIVIACAIPIRLSWREPAPAVESTVSGDRSLPAATATRPATAAEPAAATLASPAAANPLRPVLAPARPESASSSAAARLPQLGAPALNGPVRVGGAVRAPIRTFNVNPIYPEEAQAAHVEGVVILQITVGEDGSVRDAVALRSIPELDQAAIDAVLQWQYEPTLLNGEPVEVEMTVTINFTLR